jgi:hypothetical protein
LESDAVKITKQLQDKLEDIYRSLDFVVRYEKGSFQSGYCILENQNVLVINKFFPLESKVNTLIDVLKQLNPDPEKVEEKHRKLLKEVLQTTLPA